MKLGFSAEDELFRQECADWLNAEMAGAFKDIKGITKLTASPESAVATSVGLVPSTCVPGLAKVIACGVLSTVMVTAAASPVNAGVDVSVAVITTLLKLPALVAVPVITPAPSMLSPGGKPVALMLA